MMQQYVGTKIITAWEEEKNGQPGYAVKYADGYTSWSPEAAFEDAYTPLGHIDNLPVWQQRVYGELVSLERNLSKLNIFMGTSASDHVSPEEKGRLNQQVAVMNLYTGILAARIAAFKVQP